MKILCDRQQLQDAFAVVGGIPPLKTPKPIVQNVLARADDDKLTLYATDLEMSARVTIDSVKVKKAGSVLLPARETAALLRELTDPTLTLESKEFRCKIESGSGSFVLLGDDPEQFPSQPEFTKTRSIVVPAERFLRMIRQSAFAAAREETRFAINGILLDVRDGCLRLVATDGRRLALNYQNLETPGEDFRAVVPIRALNALSRAIPDGEQNQLTISISQNQIGFALGNTQLVSQLLDNRFPEYEQVIPKVADSTIEITKAALESNLRKVSILSSGDVRMVRFTFHESNLALAAESTGVGRADVTMQIDMKGPGGAISFNPDYLLDALKVCEQDVLRIDMTDDSTPAKFTLGEAYSYVLMPISGS